jgi:hypothetical protein
MDVISPVQILLDGTMEIDEPEMMQSHLERFSKASAEELGLVNLTQG